MHSAAYITMKILAVLNKSTVMMGCVNIDDVHNA